MGETGRGDVAIDTVRVSGGPCVIMPGVAGLDKYTGCSFNTDMCGYLAQNVPADTATSQAGRFYIQSIHANLPELFNYFATPSVIGKCNASDQLLNTKVANQFRSKGIIF